MCFPPSISKLFLLPSLRDDLPFFRPPHTRTHTSWTAKAVLDERGARYTVVELDMESDGKAVRAEMGQMLGRTSVPAIW